MVKNKKSNSIVPLQKDAFILQENEGGGVTVAAKPKILRVGEKPVFEVGFNTHSVNLDFDVAQQSLLVDDKGNIASSSVWEGTGPGSHHRSGILTFSTPLSQTEYVELVIKNVAGIAERKFFWNLE